MTDRSPVVRPTTIVEAPGLSSRLGIDAFLATETFQYTGSFKFRGAYSVASGVPHRLLIAASSGNFGQALAYACSLLDKSSIIVMPTTSAQVKIDAVRSYGGQVEFVDVRVTTRQQRVAELAREHPDAYVASAYDDPLVIAGNSSLGRELGELDRRLDVVVSPIGGGGLSSGVIKGIRETGRKIEVIGAEPRSGNRAARSLQAGAIVTLAGEPPTIADGARTLSLGRHNWQILQTGLAGVVEVGEDDIKEAVRLLFRFANLKAEPTGALTVAALLTSPQRFHGKSVCCVVSGGNVDERVYVEILEGTHT
jgi:threonine dehydratase